MSGSDDLEEDGMVFRFNPLAVACVGLVLVIGGCAAQQSSTSASTTTTAATTTDSGAKPGMNAAGEVVDSSLIESGSGKTVKGINDWEGEITGKPFPGSKFTKLKIGMPRAEVEKLIGPPTDEGTYQTGKAYIPWYFGSDKERTELAYKGQGRLVFAHDGGWGGGTFYLTWIIYNKNDTGYR